MSHTVSSRCPEWCEPESTTHCNEYTVTELLFYEKLHVFLISYPKILMKVTVLKYNHILKKCLHCNTVIIMAKSSLISNSWWLNLVSITVSQPAPPEDWRPTTAELNPQTNQSCLNCSQRQHISTRLRESMPSLVTLNIKYMHLLWHRKTLSLERWIVFPSLTHVMEHCLTPISMRISSHSAMSSFSYTALFHSHSPPLASFDLDSIYLLYSAQADGTDWIKY